MYSLKSASELAFVPPERGDIMLDAGQSISQGIQQFKTLFKFMVYLQPERTISIVNIGDIPRIVFPQSIQDEIAKNFYEDSPLFDRVDNQYLIIKNPKKEIKTQKVINNRKLEKEALNYDNLDWNSKAAFSTKIILAEKTINKVVNHVYSSLAAYLKMKFSTGKVYVSLGHVGAWITHLINQTRQMADQPAIEACFYTDKDVSHRGCHLCNIVSNTDKLYSMDRENTVIWKVPSGILSFEAVSPVGGASWQRVSVVRDKLLVQPNASTRGYIYKSVLWASGTIPEEFLRDIDGGNSTHDWMNLNFDKVCEMANEQDESTWLTYHTFQEQDHIHFHRTPRKENHPINIGKHTLSVVEAGLILDIIRVSEMLHKSERLELKHIVDVPRPFKCMNSKYIAVMARIIMYLSPLQKEFSKARFDPNTLVWLLDSIDEWAMSDEAMVLKQIIETEHFPVSQTVFNIWEKERPQQWTQESQPNYVILSVNVSLGNSLFDAQSKTIKDYLFHKSGETEKENNINTNDLQKTRPLKPCGVIKLKRKMPKISYSDHFLRLPQIIPRINNVWSGMITEHDRTLLEVEDFDNDIFPPIPNNPHWPKIVTRLFKVTASSGFLNRSGQKLAEILDTLGWKDLNKQMFADLCCGAGGFAKLLTEIYDMVGIGFTLDPDRTTHERGNKPKAMKGFEPIFCDIIKQKPEMWRQIGSQNDIRLMLFDGNADTEDVLIELWLSAFKAMISMSRSAKIVFKIQKYSSYKLMNIIAVILSCLNSAVIVKPKTSNPISEEFYICAQGINSYVDVLFFNGNYKPKDIPVFQGGVYFKYDAIINRLQPLIAWRIVHLEKAHAYSDYKPICNTVISTGNALCVLKSLTDYNMSRCYEFHLYSKKNENIHHVINNLAYAFGSVSISAETSGNPLRSKINITVCYPRFSQYDSLVRNIKRGHMLQFTYPSAMVSISDYIFTINSSFTRYVFEVTQDNYVLRLNALLNRYLVAKTLIQQNSQTVAYINPGNAKEIMDYAGTAILIDPKLSVPSDSWEPRWIGIKERFTIKSIRDKGIDTLVCINGLSELMGEVANQYLYEHTVRTIEGLAMDIMIANKEHNQVNLILNYYVGERKLRPYDEETGYGLDTDLGIVRTRGKYNEPVLDQMEIERNLTLIAERLGYRCESYIQALEPFQSQEVLANIFGKIMSEDAYLDLRIITECKPVIQYEFVRK